MGHKVALPLSMAVNAWVDRRPRKESSKVGIMIKIKTT